MTRVEELYQQYVVAHDLERSGLFEALRERYDPAATVLYPGCFLHITPSFSFQYIVYVDRNELARSFFADAEDVLQLIKERKQYRQQPYVRFIDQDFTKPLPVPEASFGLLLSLYAPGISRSCASYLKIGGILLTNDHQGDAAEAAADKNLELIAVVKERRGSYEFSDEDLEEYLIPKRPQRAAAGTQRTLGRPDYARTADYYVFRRVRPTPSPQRATQR